MKTARKISLSLFFFLLFIASQAQEKLQLKLETGQSIEFSHTYTQYFSLSFPAIKNLKELEEQWLLEVKVLQQLNDHKYMLELHPKRYITNSFFNRGPNVHFDSMFPTDPSEAAHLKESLVLYDIICDTKLKLGIDLAKNELITLENEALNAELNKRLQQQDLPSESIKNLSKQLSSTINQLTKTTSEYLLKFNHANFLKKDSLQLADNDFLITQRSEKQIQLAHQETIRHKTQTEEHRSKIILNPTNGLITESTHNISYLVLGKDNQYKPRSKSQTSYMLLHNSKQNSKQLTISGYIEHPEWDSFQIIVPEAIAGNDSKKYQLLLDSTNHFSITIHFSYQNLFFLKNHHKQYPSRKFYGTYMYGEPGDTIRFQLLGNKGSRTIKHTGSHAIENTLLFQQIEEINSLHKLDFNISRIPINLNVSFDDFKKDFKPIFETIKSLGLTNSDFPEKVPEKSKHFIIAQLEMLKLSIVLNLVKFKTLFIHLKNIEETESIFQNFEKFIDDFEISRYYHQNSTLSRHTVTDYTRYWLDKSAKYTLPLKSFSELANSATVIYRYRSILRDYADHLSLFLQGAPLAYEKANILLYNLTYSPPIMNLSNETWYAQQTDLYQNIVSISNDSLLNNYLHEELTKLKSFLDGQSFDQRLLVNPQGDTTSIANFIGEKPLVLYISQGNWGNSRYYFDDLSEKYPDVNFVYLVEGGSFDDWTSYLQEATPKAHQLFLNTKQSRLSKMFKLPNSGPPVFVFDKNGELITYNADLNQIGKYIKKARASAEPPQKEVDQSTLFGIIWFMGGTMLLALVAFLIFKARMRTKLRKQKQEKRLQELQLSAIRAQMNPHFLFNSLNSVQNLIQKNQGREAHLYLSDFAGLIRKVLKNSQQEELSLAEELETLNQYIKLEQLRFNFEFEQVVDESIDQNHFMVPSLILQPLAENAILHGLQHLQGVRKLKVEVKNLGTMIQINMEDNGIGLKKSSQIKSNSNGIGLNLNEERLKLMAEKYGGQYTFRLVDLSQENRQGTRVEITIPEEL
ncbi:histidine kinase [Sunxiuqinia elliptica]